MKRFTLAIAVLLAHAALADDVPVSETKASTGERARVFYNDNERKHAVLIDNERTPLETTVVSDPNDVVQVRRFYVAPIVGFEIATLGAALYRDQNGNVDSTRLVSGVAGAPAFGAMAGWRLGNFNIGARYQGSLFVDQGPENLMLNKVYGEIGFNTRQNRTMFSGYLDFGWASASQRSAFYNGVGGKAGLGLDFLLNRFFTIGPGLEFDTHAYNVPGQWIVAYGGTATVRFGFQL